MVFDSKLETERLNLLVLSKVQVSEAGEAAIR